MADRVCFYLSDKVSKVTGDYRRSGVVVGVVLKASGAVRYVVEYPDGLLLIHAAEHLLLTSEAAEKGLLPESEMAIHRLRKEFVAPVALL